jgi:hypothetical protein
MHLQREIASKPTWPERPARPSSLGPSGAAFRYTHGCSRLGASEGLGRPRVSPVGFAFSQDHQRHRGVIPSGRFCPQKSALFQHVWHCLIYSGVYLFQSARHMALLLKTSSALPAHHCIRQASRPQGWLPRAFLPFPSHSGAHCSSRL